VQSNVKRLGRLAQRLEEANEVGPVPHLSFTFPN
jgi:hypothetical protein